MTGEISDDPLLYRFFKTKGKTWGSNEDRRTQEQWMSSDAHTATFKKSNDEDIERLRTSPVLGHLCKMWLRGGDRAPGDSAGSLYHLLISFHEQYGSINVVLDDYVVTRYFRELNELVDADHISRLCSFPDEGIPAWFETLQPAVDEEEEDEDDSEGWRGFWQDRRFDLEEVLDEPELPDFIHHDFSHDEGRPDEAAITPSAPGDIEGAIDATYYL